MDIFLRYVTVILIFIVVMAILLLTTKYLAYKSKKMMKGNYMNIVESLSLGVNNRLHLVKVDKEFFIISASNKNVEFLARVNISDFSEKEIKNPISEVIDFKAILKKNITNFNFGKPNTRNKANSSEFSDGKTEDENYSAKPINNDVFKSNLERLRHLTNSMNDSRGQDEQENKN